MNWKKVFREFYDNNEAGGSSRWLVSPMTVEKFITGLIKSMEKRMVEKEIDDLENILRNGHGGGNFRRLLLMKISKERLKL